MSGMDNDTTDLIRRLCARAGMVMEDMSLLPVTMPVGRTDNLADALSQLRQAAADIARLVAAAEVISRRT